ncbi:hypothetical protein, partial [Thermoflexus sp.]|uniref:hypothetical protein n=1 Tax=Thermoflexus sp. TaxID=1969742 RepID=UPI002ADDA266
GRDFDRTIVDDDPHGSCHRGTSPRFSDRLRASHEFLCQFLVEAMGILQVQRLEQGREQTSPFHLLVDKPAQVELLQARVFVFAGSVKKR